MKKYFFYTKLVVLALVMATLVNSCSKDEPKVRENKKFPAPKWQADTSGRYPFSMTAVVQIEGLLNLARQPYDELGAFVNGECRGTGIQVNLGTKLMYNIIIMGTSSENSRITFKYYNSSTQNMFVTPDGFLPFKVDDSFGSPDMPKLLPLEVSN